MKLNCSRRGCGDERGDGLYRKDGVFELYERGDGAFRRTLDYWPMRTRQLLETPPRSGIR